MKVYLVQHAHAKSKDEDAQRGLSDTGRETITKLSEYAKKLKISVSEIRHSDKLRAKETAKILANRLGLSDKTKESIGLAPNDDVKPLRDELLERTEDIMIVGHLPFLGKLASLILCGSKEKDIISFKMNSIVCLNKDESNKFSIEWMLI